MWAAFGVLIAIGLFLQSSRTISLASHDAQIEPDLSGRVVLAHRTVLPDFRVDTGWRIAWSSASARPMHSRPMRSFERYAFIASQPDGPIEKVRDAVAEMAVDAAIKGAVLGLVPLLLWVVVGATRRRDLWRRARSPKGVIAGIVVAALALALWAPWRPDEEVGTDEPDWITLAEFLGPTFDVPNDDSVVEVLKTATTTQTRRLIESALETYDKSLKFYAEAEEAAGDLEFRTPAADETVVVLVSDRHDNIGMDAVARAVADRGGATAVFNAGDDTSTGSRWEAFSLDSLTAAYDDLDGRWGVAGNHDHGSFVGSYLADSGWTMLDGEVVVVWSRRPTTPSPSTASSEPPWSR